MDKRILNLWTVRIVGTFFLLTGVVNGEDSKKDPFATFSKPAPKKVEANDRDFGTIFFRKGNPAPGRPVVPQAIANSSDSSFPTPEKPALSKEVVDFNSSKGDGLFTFDLNQGAAAKINGKSPIEARIAALNFAVNSLNVNNSKLFDAREQIRAKFPDGKIPKSGLVTFDLSTFLNPDQLTLLEQTLTNDPYRCNRTDPVRVDSFVNQVFNPTNYYALMGFLQNRAAFERQVGIQAEFNQEIGGRLIPIQKDLSNDTKRLLIKPGESGVANAEGFRVLVSQRQRNGLPIVRTGDINKFLANTEGRNLSKIPASHVVDAHEEIWALPNGFRAYALRNQGGALQDEAPNAIVSRRIFNPVTCLTCHDRGYVSTDSVYTDIREDILDEDGVGKKLFRFSQDEFTKDLAESNRTYIESRKLTGSDNSKIIPLTLSAYETDINEKEIEKEFGAPYSAVKEELSSPSVSLQTGKLSFDVETPTFSRPALDRTVNGRSHFCLIKDAIARRANQGGQNQERVRSNNGH